MPDNRRPVVEVTQAEVEAMKAQIRTENSLVGITRKHKNIPTHYVNPARCSVARNPRTAKDHRNRN